MNGTSESSENWLSGYSRRINFPALPTDINTAQLVFTCLEQSMFQPDSPIWEITLDFTPATGKESVYPLIDLPTPEPSSSASEFGEESYATDIQLVVDHYVSTDKNLILFGSLKTLSGNLPVEGFEKKAIHLVDSNGMEIPLLEDPTVIDPSDQTPGNNSHAWAYVIESKYEAGQATLSVDSAWIRINDIARFKVDLGDSPQPGQKIMIEKSVNIAGREILIKSAEVNKKGDGLSFTIIKPKDISGIILVDFDHPLLGGGGYESYEFTYRDGLPTGEINITIDSALVQINGPWETKFDLPESIFPSTSMEGTTACFTQSSWQAALIGSPALPEGLGGTLGISTYMAPDFLYRVMLSSLDSSDQELLSFGNGTSLSPDGHQVIFNTDTGLQLMDLSTQMISPLVDTGKNDRGAVWAPDGSKIAYTRGPSSGLIGGPGPYSIIISNPDGTQQMPVVDDGEANTVFAWHPDGQSLIYTVTGPDGASARSINISTGQVTQLFDLDYSNTTVALSPDGKQIAYQEMLPADNYGIYIADLDDLSNPRLVVDGAPVVVTRPFWSPDGEWLIASVVDESLSNEKEFMTLINVDSCQIIPLLNLTGYVTSWNP
jgi:hypothetical protein